MLFSFIYTLAGESILIGKSRIFSWIPKLIPAQTQSLQLILKGARLNPLHKMLLEYSQFENKLSLLSGCSCFSRPAKTTLGTRSTYCGQTMGQRLHELKINVSIARGDIWHLIYHFHSAKYPSSSTGLASTFVAEKSLFTWRCKCF